MVSRCSEFAVSQFNCPPPPPPPSPPPTLLCNFLLAVVWVVRTRNSCVLCVCSKVHATHFVLDNVVSSVSCSLNAFNLFIDFYSASVAVSATNALLEGVALPKPTYSACWMFDFFFLHNPSNSDMVYGIFNVRTDVNACDCTREMYGHRKSVWTKSWLWEKNPFSHRGIEPASAACRSDALPTKLRPHPLKIVLDSRTGSPQDRTKTFFFKIHIDLNSTLLTETTKCLAVLHNGFTVLRLSPLTPSPEQPFSFLG